MAEEKGTCGMAAREAHPGAGTSRRLGRKEDVCVWGGGGAQGTAGLPRSGRRAVPSLEGSPEDPPGRGASGSAAALGVQA